MMCITINCHIVERRPRKPHPSVSWAGWQNYSYYSLHSNPFSLPTLYSSADEEEQKAEEEAIS